MNVMLLAVEFFTCLEFDLLFLLLLLLIRTSIIYLQIYAPPQFMKSSDPRARNRVFYLRGNKRLGSYCTMKLFGEVFSGRTVHVIMNQVR